MTGPLNLSETPVEATDLRRTGNVCDRLVQYRCSPQTPDSEDCVGYIETPGSSKHFLYLTRTKGEALLNSGPEAVNVSSILQQATDMSMSLLNQLEAAHKLAVAVLQLCCTPWLPARWSLDELSCFGSPNADMTACLRTMHVSLDMTSNPAKNSIPQPSATKVAKDTQRELECLHGIHNMALFSLGVALVEIAHRKPLQSMRSEGEHDIAAARRLAGRPTYLGPKYTTLVQRCIRGDFGVGNSIETDELQSAVHNKVVCQLEELMAECKL